MLLVANEFFDALPVRQFEKTAQGWRERMVGLASDGETLMFALAPGATPFARFLPDATDGAQAEISEAGRALAAAIGVRVTRDGGWALIVDYGYEQGSAATLQAVRGHKGASVLDQPGETDLSAHVDFAALAAAAAAPTFGPVSPGRLPAAAGNPAACGNPQGARQRRPAQRNRRDVGALDRTRPNGHLVPRHGRG